MYIAYTSIYMCTCTYMGIITPLCMYTYKRTYVHMHTNAHTCTRTGTLVCVRGVDRGVLGLLRATSAEKLERRPFTPHFGHYTSPDSPLARPPKRAIDAQVGWISYVNVYARIYIYTYIYIYRDGVMWCDLI